MKGREKLYEVLRQRIIGGFYSPGAQLKEEPLARESGLSRTPVRTVLKALIDDGLATSEGGQGVRVAIWSDRDIEETFNLRMLLEPYATSLAAGVDDAALAQALRGSNDAMAAAIDAGRIDRVQEANRQFHLALLHHCGSPRLRAILENMIDTPVMVRSFYLSDRSDLQQSLAHHREIAAAVMNGNVEAARHAMQLHLSVSFRRFIGNRALYRQQSDGTAAGGAGRRG